MCPRTKFQLALVRAETLEAILTASLKLFAKKGFDRTAVEDIAKTAKISKGLVYHYFKSKDDILDSLLMNAFDEIMKLEKNIPVEIPPDQIMQTWISLSIERLKSNRVQWQLLFSILFQHNIQKKISGFIQRFRSAALKQMERSMKRLGSPTPYADALIVGCLLDGIGLNYVLAPDDMPLDVLTQRVQDIIRLMKGKK